MYMDTNAYLGVVSNKLVGTKPLIGKENAAFSQFLSELTRQTPAISGKLILKGAFSLGTLDAYNKLCLAQLTELWENYGDLAEVVSASGTALSTAAFGLTD